MKRKAAGIIAGVIVVAALCLSGLPVMAETTAPGKTGTSVAPAEVQKSGGLAKKLIDGSPWRFTTKYGDTILYFRLTNDGKLQRRTDANQNWEDLEVSAEQAYSYITENGHVLTYSLGEDGSPTANHSKHSTQFKSVKQ